MCAAPSLASVVPQRSFVATKLSQLQAVMVALAHPKEPSVTMNLGASVVTVIEYIPKVRPRYLSSCTEYDRTNLPQSYSYRILYTSQFCICLYCNVIIEDLSHQMPLLTMYLGPLDL